MLPTPAIEWLKFVAAGYREGPLAGVEHFVDNYGGKALGPDKRANALCVMELLLNKDLIEVGDLDEAGDGIRPWPGTSKDVLGILRERWPEGEDSRKDSIGFAIWVRATKKGNEVARSPNSLS